MLHVCDGYKCLAAFKPYEATSPGLKDALQRARQLQQPHDRWMQVKEILQVTPDVL